MSDPYESDSTSSPASLDSGFYDDEVPGVGGSPPPKVFGPPTPLLYISMTLALASAAAAYLATRQTPLAFAPWAVAAFGGCGLLAVFSNIDAKRRATHPYASDPAADLIYRLAALLAAASVVATAVQLGLWAGRAW
jgi:hypothetical protein